MLNEVEPGPDPKRTRNRVLPWPTRGRRLFWSFAVGIPLLSVGAGVAFLIASNQLDSAIKAYNDAELCPVPAMSASCYQLLPGTLVSFTISRGKTGDTTNMTLQLEDGNRSTWAKTAWAEEDALQVGAPVRARIDQGAITTIYVRGIGIETKDNPMYRKRDLRLAAIVVPILGLIITAICFVSWSRLNWRNLRATSPIDPALPLGQPDMLLRHALMGDQPGAMSWLSSPRSIAVNLPMTLRPRPIPAGYRWWVGLIAVGVAVPNLVLRMRTPASIAQGVIAVTALAMLAALIARWLYRHRRMLVVDDMSVRLVNLFGASHVISRSDIGGLAFPIIMSSNPQVPDEPRLLILDATGRCLLGLRRYYSTDDDAAQLAAALRIPLKASASRPTTASEVRRTIPGAASWPEAHPNLLGILLVPPILGAIVLLVWVLAGVK